MDYRLGELMHLILVCQAIKKKSFDGIRMFSIKKLGEIGSLYSSYCERVVKHVSDQTHFHRISDAIFRNHRGLRPSQGMVDFNGEQNNVVYEPRFPQIR